MRLDHGPHVEVRRHEHVVDCAGALLLVDGAEVDSGRELVLHFAEVAGEHALAREVVERVQERVAPRAAHEPALRVVQDRHLGLVGQRLVERPEDLRERTVRWRAALWIL